MHIAILGTGSMASALGNKLAKAGHQIMFGSRDAGRAKSLADMMGPNVQGGSYANAGDFGQAIILAVTWLGVDNALEEMGSLDGRVLIDCTNPLDPDSYDEMGGMKLSAGEYIAKKSPDAQVVKAFNTIFAETINNPNGFEEGKPSVFYCTDDKAAKDIAVELIKDVGCIPINCGNLANARYLEPMGIMLIKLGYPMGWGTDIAFKLIEKED
jgi:predicted dinucleotide-binding enzyme